MYLLSADAEKADRGEDLLERSGAISVQVLNEFTVVAIPKLGLSFVDVREVLSTIGTVCVTHPQTVEHYEIAERYGFSFYYSVIVASALLADCKILYSEDLRPKQVI